MRSRFSGRTPAKRGELSGFGSRAVWKLRKDVAELIAKIDFETFAGGEDGEDGGDLGTGFFASKVQPVLTPKAIGRMPFSHSF